MQALAQNVQPGNGEPEGTKISTRIPARLDRLPASRHTLKLITLISLGGWFEFYDLFFTARGRSHRR